MCIYAYIKAYITTLMMIMHHPNIIGVTKGLIADCICATAENWTFFEEQNKTGHVAQSRSLNLLWHRMTKIDPPVKRPEMSRWREPLSGGHGGLACVRVPGSDPGRIVWEHACVHGSHSRFIVDSRAARAFVTGVWCAWLVVIIITAPNFVPSFVSSARMHDAGW